MHIEQGRPEAIRFMGYRRASGAVGVRNHVLILSSVVCANTAAQKIARGVRGTVLAVHQHGCAQVGADADQTVRTLVGFATNPNVIGVIVVGLGCEVVDAEMLAEKIAQRGQEVAALVIQKMGGTTKTVKRGREIAREMLKKAATCVREPIDIGELTLGTECGGSDACSGITANPALGAASDMLVAAGGTVILSETTELIGTEAILAARARDEGVAKDVYRIIERFERVAMSMGVDMRGANPAPGNIKGGITTIEEKSLGCVHKGGTSTVEEVIDYAERPTKRGLVIMDTPGHDVEQITAMAAGGAQVVVFTTGRGSPTGCPIVPVIKVATNSEMYQRMRENMDINAGTIVTGRQSVANVGRRIFEEVREVSSGKKTKTERLGHWEFAINRIGPSL